jgi:hypothetical protein
MPNEQRKTAEQWLSSLSPVPTGTRDYSMAAVDLTSIQQIMNASEAVGRAKGVVEGMREAANIVCGRPESYTQRSILLLKRKAILSAADEKEKQL